MATLTPDRGEIRAASATPGHRRGLRGLASRRPLTMFFALAYGVTWILWTPIVVLGLPAFNAETFAPSLVALPAVAIGVTGTAFLMAGLVDGRAGVRRMLQRLVSWRHGLQWYLVALFLLPLAAILVAEVMGSMDAGVALEPASLAIYPAAFLAHFIFGPLFEESGWRGFALPRMQHRWGPLLGSFYLALLWAGWHFFLYVPMWFGGGATVDLVILQTVSFTVSVILMTFIFTWLSNNTRASLLLVILMHGSIDGMATYMQRLAADGAVSPSAVATVTDSGATVSYLIIFLILLATTRGKLGYPRYTAEAEALDLAPNAPREAEAGTP